MPVALPYIDDGISSYLYSPSLSTLYGNTVGINRFIRVVEDGKKSTIITITEPSGASDVIKDVIETVEFSIFMQFMTYGYTPYIEVLYGRAGTSGINLEDSRDMFLSQTVLRNYECRMKNLMDMCRLKRFSIDGRKMSNPVTAELVSELEGVMELISQLMDGEFYEPANIIEPNYHAAIPFKELEQKFELIEARLYSGDFCDLPFKMSQSYRNSLFKAYRCKL